MINLRKCLSFSVFAIFALAVVCLAFSQVAVAKVTNMKAVNAEGISDLYRTGVPLPDPDRDRSGGTAAAVVPDGPSDLQDLGPLQVFVPDEALRSVASAKRSGQSNNTKSGGEDVSTATVIPSVPYTDLGTTTGALDDYNEDCPYTGSTAPDVVYAYTPAVNEIVNLSLCNSTYDTKIFVYENAVTAGSPYACNDDFCPGWMSYIEAVPLTAGNTYYIVVDGYSGADFGDYQLDVTIYVSPYGCHTGDQVEGEICGSSNNNGCFGGGPDVVPFLTPGVPICGTSWHTGAARDADFFRYDATNPGGEIVNWAGTAEFEFSLLIYEPSPGPAAPCSFLGGGAWVAGTNAATSLFVLPGTYYFRVAVNSYNGEDCGAGPAPDGGWRYRATMTSLAVTPIDDCEAAGTMVTGINAFDLTGMTGSGGSYGGYLPNGWYAWTADCSGIASFSMCNTMPDPLTNDFQLSVWDACESAGGSELGYGEDDCNSWAPDIQNLLVSAGTTYLIEIATWGPAVGNLEITCTAFTLQADDCVDALSLGETPGELLITNGANTDGPNDACDLGADIWVIYTPTCTGEATITTCAGRATFDTKISAYDGGTCLDLDPRPPIGCNDDGGGCPNNGSSLDILVTAGQQYLLRLGGWRATAGVDPAQEGLMDLGISCSTTIQPRPVHDECQNALAVNPVGPGIGFDETISIIANDSNATDRTCFGADGTWYRINAAFCFDLKVDRCGTEALANGSSAWWIGADYPRLYTDCPCADGATIPQSVGGGGCAGYPDPAEFVIVAFFDGLLPGDYYFFRENINNTPDREGLNQLNFVFSEIECAHCAASGNLALCGPAGNEHITNLSIGSFSNASGCDGYADYVSATGPGPFFQIPLYRGLSYPVSITLGGSILDSKDDVIGVWADWGQDFDFTNPGDELYQGAADATSASFSLSVPFGALLPGDGIVGYTRLRARVVKTADDPFGPCGDVLFGEAEDYELVLSDLICGDFDGSGAPDGPDVDFLKDYYFNSGGAPDPAEQGDINADCSINIADIIALADHVYRAAAAPVCIPCL